MASNPKTGFSILHEALTHASILYPNSTSFFDYGITPHIDQNKAVNAQKTQELREKLEKLKDEQNTRRRKSFLRPPSTKISTKSS